MRSEVPRNCCICQRIFTFLSLAILLARPARAQTNADLALSFSNAPTSVSAGQYFRFTIYSANSGPDAAPNVIVSDTLPANCTFVGASATQGVVTQYNGVVTCTLGALPIYRAAAVTIELKTTTTGSLTNIAAVSAGAPDPNPTNNEASFTTRVTSARFFGVGATHA